MSAKPHLKSVNGVLVISERAGPETPVDAARRRYGKPFAIESGSTWQPKPVPVLTAWLQQRGRGQ